MRKHVEESVATDAAAGRGRGGRFSAGRKREVVMRLFNEQLGLMETLKGTTRRQNVTVEHVHVHAGGQAIVGVVSGAKKGPGRASDE